MKPIAGLLLVSLVVCGCAAPWRPADSVAGQPPPPEVNAVMLRGFFDFGSAWGLDSLRNRLYMAGAAHSFNHFEQQSAVHAARRLQQLHPARPLVLIGHSFGGDAAIEVAERLAREGVGVDLLVQVDSVGYGDDVLPPNVRRGLNLFQRRNPIIHGEALVRGSANHHVMANGAGGWRSGHTGIMHNPGTVRYIDRALRVAATRKAALFPDAH